MSVPFSMRNVEAMKHVIKGYVNKVELRYSTQAFQVKTTGKVESSLKMYLTIKDQPLIKKYVLGEAIKWMVKDRLEVDNLTLFEARYDLEREMGIKK